MNALPQQITLEFTLNGKGYRLQVKPGITLQDILRDILGFTGTKKGCEQGVCGSCTVLLNGKAVNSCLVLAPLIQGQTVTTIEGLAQGQDLHPLQKSFILKGAIQCGYCTPGMIMSAKALLDETPVPSEAHIRKSLRGNLCRCTGYVKIIEAVQAAAGLNRGGKEG
jgi:aerobic carbon-monoxide dehydrogenase small subunit